jgi:hypothetical protein
LKELKGSISASVHRLSGNVKAVPGKLATVTETYLLLTEDGGEIPAVAVDQEVVFTATANDIRLGAVAATASGVTEGTKDIPAYHTTEGIALIQHGSEFCITIRTADRYNYTKLQAIICPYNTSMANSVAAQCVSVNGGVYAAGSATAIAEVTLDHENKRIKFGITNTYGVPCIIRYFTYKEEY